MKKKITITIPAQKPRIPFARPSFNEGNKKKKNEKRACRNKEKE